MPSVTENINILPPLALRKYISYARQYVKPKLTKEAGAMLQNYYLELRSRRDKCGGLSVYNRKLEAMIRLTEVQPSLILTRIINLNFVSRTSNINININTGQSKTRIKCRSN